MAICVLGATETKCLPKRRTLCLGTFLHKMWFATKVYSFAEILEEVQKIEELGKEELYPSSSLIETAVG